VTKEIKKTEKLLDLGNGMAIWKVHLDALRERDKNARIMSKDTFERLSKNIENDKRLESLPLCTFNKEREGEFLILSGHHRTRAARAAGLQTIYILVIEEELTKDEIVAKQLAHNALVGYDDQQILTELYAEINDVNARLESGLTDIDLQTDFPSVSTYDIGVSLDYEALYILFLPSQVQKLEEILGGLEPEARKYIADKADFERMKESALEISKRKNIRNIAAIMSVMLNIVEEYLEKNPPEEEADG